MTDILDLPGDIVSEVGTVVERQQTLGNEQSLLMEQIAAQGIDTTQKAIVDTERNVLKTINNVQENAFHSGRFVAKNVTGLIDNQLDNIFNLLQDIRVDIANGLQMFGVITATGLVIVAILYGDTLVKRGISLGEINLF
jgi:hypothetical protein